MESLWFLVYPTLGFAAGGFYGTACMGLLLLECLVSVTFFMFLGISFVISRIIDSLNLFGMPGTHFAGL